MFVGQSSPQVLPLGSSIARFEKLDQQSFVVIVEARLVLLRLQAIRPEVVPAIDDEVWTLAQLQEAIDDILVSKDLSRLFIGCLWRDRFQCLFDFDQCLYQLALMSEPL